MASGWIAAAIALVGTLVGATATFAANWLATRMQFSLAVSNQDSSREQQRADVRRDAYATYLTAVDSFMEQARELSARMEAARPDSECVEARAAYLAGWQALEHVVAPAVIAGPEDLAKLAEKLKGKLGTYSNKVDEWYTAHMAGSEEASQVTRSRNAAYAAREAFIELARKYAYPNEDKLLTASRSRQRRPVPPGTLRELSLRVWRPRLRTQSTPSQPLEAGDAQQAQSE